MAKRKTKAESALTKAPERVGAKYPNHTPQQRYYLSRSKNNIEYYLSPGAMGWETALTAARDFYDYDSAARFRATELGAAESSQTLIVVR